MDPEHSYPSMFCPTGISFGSCIESCSARHLLCNGELQITRADSCHLQWRAAGWWRAMFGTEVANASANHATCEPTASHANACAAFRTLAFVGCEESMLSFAGGTECYLCRRLLSQRHPLQAVFTGACQGCHGLNVRGMPSC